MQSASSALGRARFSVRAPKHLPDLLAADCSPHLVPFCRTLSSVNDGSGTLGNHATAHVFDARGNAQILTYPGPDSRSRRIDAVSAVLMADRIYNEYQISTALAAASDWVVTMPTKAFYVDPSYIGYVATTAIPPFPRIYDGDRNAFPRFAPTAFSRCCIAGRVRSRVSPLAADFYVRPGRPRPACRQPSA